MPAQSYHNLDLVLEFRGDVWDVRVVDSPAGEARGTFSDPFEPREVENLVLRMGARRGMRRAGGAPESAAVEFGRRLYDAVFRDEVGFVLLQSLDRVRDEGNGLRIRLRLGDAGMLADLPWEYLHSAHLGRPLALSLDTPLVRYIDLGHPPDALQVELPLRILVVTPSPNDVEVLDSDREVANLRAAVADLVAAGSVEVHDLARSTVADLQHHLRREAFHIVHFIGHGVFDERTDHGMLVFEDAAGRARPVTGGALGTLLHDHRTLQLVVLNACEGARMSVADPVGGVAQALVRQGIPAVIAMQFEISDAAATTFSHELYLAVADGLPIDAAISEARKALYLQDQGVEWGTPVLHMRAPDGVIFDVGDATSLAPLNTQADPGPAEPDPLTADLLARVEAIERDGQEAGYLAAIGILQRVLAIDPDNEPAASELARLQAGIRLDPAVREEHPLATHRREVESSPPTTAPMTGSSSTDDDSEPGPDAGGRPSTDASESLSIASGPAADSGDPSGRTHADGLDAQGGADTTPREGAVRAADSSTRGPRPRWWAVAVIVLALMATVAVGAAISRGLGGDAYRDYSITGIVPAFAQEADVGVRVNTECDCRGTVDVTLAEFDYREEGDDRNRVPNPSFDNGTTGWGFAGTAHTSLGSDDGTTGLQITATDRQSLYLNSDRFVVTPGARYELIITALVSEDSTDAGYFNVIFLEDDDGESDRHTLPFVEGGPAR